MEVSFVVYIKSGDKLKKFYFEPSDGLMNKIISLLKVKLLF